MNEILTASGIYKSYKMGQTKIEVLKGLDLTVQKGRFIAIVGASGSGKSTLLHILGALDEPDAGSVEFEGKRLDKFRAERVEQISEQNGRFCVSVLSLVGRVKCAGKRGFAGYGPMQLVRMAETAKPGQKTR